MDRITLLLIDDHAVVRAGYRQLMTSTEDIQVIGESETAEQGCQLYFELRPDVVVMDLSLPGMTGLEAIRRIIARDPGARILAFTMHDELAYLKRVMEAGARGYLSKSCDPNLLLEGVNQLAEGKQFIEPRLAEKLKATELDKAAQADGVAALSPREFDIYNLLIKGETTQQIAEALFLSPKTVANYTTGIKSKLRVSTLAEMARLALEQKG